MSLFDTASLVVTPNGVKASKLYAIKPTDGSGDLSVTRATTATRVNANGLIESVANNVPRLDYSNGTCPSILVEPQRTNLFTYSEEFDNAFWVKASAVVTANNTTSPDGNTNADKVEFNSGYINPTVIVTDNQTYTISFFAKKGTANLFQISEAFYVGTTAAFDLNTGTVTSGAGKIENYGNGWYRCSMQFTYAIGQVVSSWVIRNYQSGYIYLWGAQLEAGSYPTSYIPTTSASVTRNADVISKTGISSLIGQTEGTIFLDANISVRNNTRVLLDLNNGSNTDTIQFVLGGNTLSITIYDSGTLQAGLSGGYCLGNKKIAVGYKNNDFVLYINGTQVDTDTNGTVPTMSSINLGSLFIASSYELADSINSAALWKTRLTNDELATLTTI